MTINKVCSRCGFEMYSTNKGANWYHCYTYCEDCPTQEELEELKTK